MPKIRLEVNKLEDGTADYISLVKRPANRIPFRIIKRHPDDEESNMINLGGKLDLADIRNVIKSDGKSKGSKVADDNKPKDFTPTLVGLVVEKGEYVGDAFKAGSLGAALKEAGVKVDHITEGDDGTLLFSHDGKVPDDCIIMKASPNTLALIAGVPAEAITKDTYFAEMYGEIGFLPSLAEAKEGLQVAIQKTLKDEESPKLVADKIAADTADFTTYSERIAKYVPEVVFKADKLVSKAKAKPTTAKKSAQTDAEDIADGGKDEVLEDCPTCKGTGKVKVAKAAKADNKVVCPACEGRKCKLCSDTGKITKAEAEAITKAWPPKKAPAPADVAGGVKETPSTETAGSSATGTGGVSSTDGNAAVAATTGEQQDTAPTGVDQAAWDKMNPDDKAKIRAAAAAATSQKADKSQEAKPAATVTDMDPNLKSMLEAIQKSVGDVATDLGKVSKAQGELDTKVGELAGKVEKTELATQRIMKGTLVGGVPADDDAGDEQRTRKSELRPDALGMIDTALQPQVRTRKSYGDRLAAAQRAGRQ